MVNTLSIVFMIISFLICILLPTILTIYFYKKHRISLMAVLIGAITFLVSQIATRIPLLTLLGRQQWYLDFASNNIYAVAIFLGLTAGIFEEVARYIAMKLFMKKNLSWKNGVAFGIGHGGIEAIVLVGLTLLNYIVISFMINAGLFESTIGAQLPVGTAIQIKSMLVDAPVIDFLAGGFERIMTMAVHIAFSLIVLYSVKFKKPIYLLYAILLHALVDAPVVILGHFGLSTWALEAVIAVFAAVCLVYIIRTKKIFADKEAEVMADQEL